MRLGTTTVEQVLHNVAHGVGYAIPSLPPSRVSKLSRDGNRSFQEKERELADGLSSFMCGSVHCTPLHLRLSVCSSEKCFSESPSFVEFRWRVPVVACSRVHVHVRVPAEQNSFCKF